MKHITFLLLFISSISFGQILNDSMTFNTSRLIYSADGTVIGKDSIFRTQLLYDEGGSEIFRYTDSLIMRISYLNTEASLWTGDNEGMGSATCEESCSTYTVTFTGFTQTPNIIVDNSLQYVEIIVPGWYEVDFGATILNQSRDQFNAVIQVSKVGNDVDGYYNSKMYATLLDSGYETLSKRYDFYFNQGDKIYLITNVVTDTKIINPYLKVKLKLK